MKIGIIGSHSSDMLIKRCIDFSKYLCEEFIDDGLLTREHYDEVTIIGRCESLLNLASDCDCVILPPQCEILYHKGTLRSPVKIIPLFLYYCKDFVLPGSKVGKVVCMATDSVFGIVKEFRLDCIKEYKLTNIQFLNKHFQNHFPLYHLNSKHRDSLSEIHKKRLINKLIKSSCKKFKDYGVDSFLVTDWGYLYFLPTLNKSFGLKVKHPSISEISKLLGGLLC